MPIPREIKERAIFLVREQGKSIEETSYELRVSTRTIRRWLDALHPNYTNEREISRLKEENKYLLNFIGKLSVELERTKKNPDDQEVLQREEPPSSSPSNEDSTFKPLLPEKEPKRRK